MNGSKLLVASLLVSLAAACSSSEPAPVAAVPAPTCAPAPTALAVAKAPEPVVAPVVVAPSRATSPAPLADSAPKASQKGDGSKLKVARLVVATGVEKGKREPVGASATFKKGDFERLFAFVELENPSEPADVVVTFEKAEDTTNPAGNVTLEVGRSPRFRTWAYSRAVDRPGAWAAVVRTTEGRELARAPFDVVL